MSSSGLTTSARLRAAFFVLLVAVVLLSGCVNVEVIDRSPSALNSIPVSGQGTAEEHDLAVLAVDFDPPLNYQEILARKSRGEGITLLVAVENTGVSTERNVLVRARLSERSGETVYVEKQGTIETIAPGEIRIVHLRDTDIPFSFEYTLSVSVSPVVGETRIDDNFKTYDLLITQS
jgi:hypothetical protein